MKLASVGFKSLLAAAVVSSASWAPQLAAAPLFTFDLPSNQTVLTTSASGKDFTVSGTTVNVKAYRGAVSSGSVTSWTQLSGTGAGVTNIRDASSSSGALGADRGTDNNAGQIDANGSFVEGLLFTFNPFGWGSATIDFDLLASVDKLDIWTGSATSFGGATPLSGGTQALSNATPTDPITIALGGLQYLFVAAHDNGNANTSCSNSQATCFRIDSLELFPAQDGAVPEPGSLALLGLGLAGFAAMRRRKAGV